MKLVAGDVGGTKVLLELVEVTAERRVTLISQRYQSSSYATFDLLLTEFLGHCTGPFDAACFAVAGPVIGDRAEVTNLGWTMEAPELAKGFAIGRVSIINDFYAIALGVPLLGPGDLVPINQGTMVEHAPIAILGAGTGLGEANLVHDGVQWVVVPGEGGHADFAPQDEEQGRLLAALRRKYGGHVSWERLLSGMGLVNIHDFITGIDRAYDEAIPVEIAAAAERGDAAASRTFEIFADIYGAEAGNMALRTLARGGVFLAGGIAAKNLRSFTDGLFLRAFTRKGRFGALLATIPVNVIVNEHVGLLGAAEGARRLAK